MTCPRCHSGRLFPGLEGESSCLACGHTVYPFREPLDIPENMLAHLGQRPHWPRPVVEPVLYSKRYRLPRSE